MTQCCIFLIHRNGDYWFIKITYYSKTHMQIMSIIIYSIVLWQLKKNKYFIFWEKVKKRKDKDRKVFNFKIWHNLLNNEFFLDFLIYLSIK